VAHPGTDKAHYTLISEEAEAGDARKTIPASQCSLSKDATSYKMFTKFKRKRRHTHATCVLTFDTPRKDKESSGSEKEGYSTQRQHLRVVVSHHNGYADLEFLLFC
jgi:hypothetical protein